MRKNEKFFMKEENKSRRFVLTRYFAKHDIFKTNLSEI